MLFIEEPFNRRTPLCDLAVKYGTDKAHDMHRYTPIYHDLLNRVREEAITLLEIGVLHGASIRMWREYLPNARIFAVDSCPDRLKNITDVPNCELVHCNAGSTASIAEKILGSFPGVEFDLVIDDASHLPQQQFVAFRSLLPRVRPGGYYIVEDLGVETVGGMHPFLQYLAGLMSRQFERGIYDIAVTLYNFMAMIKVFRHVDVVS